MGFSIHLNTLPIFFEMNALFTFLTVKKLCPHLEEIKFLCKLVRFEHDNAEDVAFIKWMSFNSIKVTKGFVIVAFMERKDRIINNHLQLQLKFLPLRKNIL